MVPAGTQRVNGALNAAPVEVWRAHPKGVEVGETVYVASRHAFGTVVDLEPGNGYQFRVNMPADGSHLWCDRTDVYLHGPQMVRPESAFASPPHRQPSADKEILPRSPASPV